MGSRMTEDSAFADTFASVHEAVNWFQAATNTEAVVDGTLPMNIVQDAEGVFPLLYIFSFLRE